MLNRCPVLRAKYQLYGSSEAMRCASLFAVPSSVSRRGWSLSDLNRDSQPGTEILCSQFP